MIKQRHSKSEIASKLAQADELSQQGKLQSEIAKSLHVSVTTLHRWRKAADHANPGQDARGESATALAHAQDRIATLELENLRLRRLVTDLLLEQMRQAEAISDKTSSS
jgi:transposase-like protein